MVNVVVSGSQYKLFTQPCCGQMVREPAPAAASGDGWVLCGLIAQRALSADSYAVSFSILVLLSAALLLALLSWPFLKLMLLGEAQRVKAHDIVLVAICTLLGISLVTIGTLDFFAYSRRLQSALDDQLRVFANDIDRQAKSEIDSASRQLGLLESAVAGLRPKQDKNRAHINLAHVDALFDGDTLDAYPFFDSFSLIDEEGEQRQKLTLGSVGTLFISIARPRVLHPLDAGAARNGAVRRGDPLEYDGDTGSGGLETVLDRRLSRRRAQHSFARPDRPGASSPASGLP